jgi:hypothetical protein
VAGIFPLDGGVFSEDDFLISYMTDGPVQEVIPFLTATTVPSETGTGALPQADLSE